MSTASLGCSPYTLRPEAITCESAPETSLAAQNTNPGSPLCPLNKMFYLIRKAEKGDRRDVVIRSHRVFIVSSDRYAAARWQSEDIFTNRCRRINSVPVKRFLYLSVVQRYCSYLNIPA
ncbi:hypothetical protein Trydic_g3409 [Trypoxylus dichotomus]